MTQEMALIRQSMRTPRAAALAGIIFSLLTITSHLLVWFSIPSNPVGPAAAVVNHSRMITFTLNLLSFAGIAFLVIRRPMIRSGIEPEASAVRC